MSRGVSLSRTLAKHELLIVAGIATVWCALTSWARPLLLPDEGRYVGVAWEMMASGDWLTPTLSGLPYFHKPPLFYWISAATMSVLGTGEFAARMPSLVGALMALIATYYFVRRRFDAPTARLSLLILGTMPLFFGGAQYANLDMLVAGCITVTICFAAQAVKLHDENEPARNALVAAYASAALGVLAKGLIGVVLPGMVIVLWLALTRRPKALLKLISLPGLLIFALIAAPWFIAMQIKFPEFFDYFFLEQHFRRFTQSAFNNVHPFWFYPVVLSLTSLPWCLWLVPSLRRGFLRQLFNDERLLLLWVWLFAVVIFFSLPSSKLLGYVLPATPPLAILIAAAIQKRRAQGAAPESLFRATTLAATTICVAVIIAVSSMPLKSVKPLALNIKADMQAYDRVFLVEEAFFDVALYAALKSPPSVVEHWRDPKIPLEDTWLKELLDASRFTSSTRSKVLVHTENLRDEICAIKRSWVVTPRELEARIAWLADFKTLATTQRDALRLIDTSDPTISAALRCPQMPSTDSTKK